MKKKNLIIVFLILTLFHNRLFAQVQINFQPVIYGKTIDGLAFFQVTNQTNFDFKAALHIIVTEDKAGKIAEIIVPSIYVKKGFNSYTRSIFSTTQFRFSGNQVANIFKQTAKLPEGDYEFCYELSLIEDKPGLSGSYENCFRLNLQPLSPLLLVDPIDEEKTCNRKPTFIWQPPMPVDLNAKYRIIVAEVKDKQTPVEALSMNVPVFTIGDFREPRLNYPLTIKELENGKTYAWQIYYSVNNVLISKSEIWTFKVNCDEEKVGTNDDSYRELKAETSGDFYMAKGKLKFALSNPYNEGELSYKIFSLKELDKAVDHLPKLKLVTGMNRYELDLSGFNEFKNDEQYELDVQLPNGQKFSLRFIYKN